MFNNTTFENSRPDGIGVLEIVRDEARGDKAMQFVPLAYTSLSGDIAGPLASLRLSQTFRFTREQCAEVVEALYRFPLPGDAAVTRVEVRFGEVSIAATLKEREQAETEYAQAKAEGRQAVLATRESPDVFTLQVAGIAPDQDVVVETTYVQLARPEGLGWSLRIPLTTAPRYVRSDELNARHAQGQPLALLRDPGHRFALDLKVRTAERIESPTHSLQSVPTADGLQVTLVEGSVIPDRDCVLVWQPKQGERHPELQVLLHHDAAAKRDYFLALVTPPARPLQERGIPREVMLLVDHSGSMEGAKWEAADWAVKRFLSDLVPGDRFNLGLFHNTTRWFAKDLKPASPGEIEGAVRFLEEHHDSGGTELGVALEQALAFNRAAGERARNVLVITDAQVSDAGRILRLADQEAERRDRRRINVLCIDAAPNSFMANALAERGRGVAHFLTSSPSEEDITTALDQILAAWGQPAALNLQLAIDRAGVEVAGSGLAVTADRGGSRIDLGDLPQGLSLWVAGRASAGDAAGLTVQLRGGGGSDPAPLHLQAGADLPALKALFGARRILGLEFLISSGYRDEQFEDHLRLLGYTTQDIKPVAKVYAENERADVQAQLRHLIVHESLDYGIASSETAFVAVRQEQGQPVQGTVVVANALASGWSESFLASGAPPMPFQAMAVGTPPASPLTRTLFQGVADSMPSSPMPHALRKTRSQSDSKGKRVKVFAGAPQWVQNRAVLLDTTRPEDQQKLVGKVSLTELCVGFPQGTPKPSDLDPDLVLLIYVGDLASPVAKVRLVDLVRQKLTRPLHLSRQANQVVQIVLADPHGAWANRPPTLEVELGVS